MTGRVVLVAALALCTLALVTNTAGTSSVAMDRGLRADVAPDEDAYLGFEQETATTNGTTNLSVRVTNRLSTDVPLTRVRLTVDGERTALLGGDGLSPGESPSERVPSVDCGDRVVVSATAPDTRVVLERQVECH